MKTKQRNKSVRTFRQGSGQVMLMSVIMLGGILLTSGVIGGLLVVQQIRQSTDTVNSAKAIFAADAALEWMTYCLVVTTPDCSEYLDTFGNTPITFSNGASASSSYSIGVGATYINSQGFSGKAMRALETAFQ